MWTASGRPGSWAHRFAVCTYGVARRRIVLLLRTLTRDHGAPTLRAPRWGGIAREGSDGRPGVTARHRVAAEGGAPHPPQRVDHRGDGRDARPPSRRGPGRLARARRRPLPGH